MTLKENQKVICSFTFSAQILHIYEEYNLIEFRNIDDNKRYVISLADFKKIIQSIN